MCRLLTSSQTAHIACHGRFRADNPLFSSLQLADGPLNVYDLQRLDRAPDLLVLSACDSGLSAVRPGDELMGLAAALFPLGTAALVASIVPVPDEATHRLMLAFHAALAAGSAPPPRWRARARSSTRPSPPTGSPRPASCAWAPDDRAARLVREGQAPAAVAGDARSLRAARLRGDAPADPGRAGHPVLQAFSGRFPDPAALADAPAARGAAPVERPRLQPPRARAPARGRARRGARLAGGPDRAAGRRPVHRRGGRLVRLGPPGRRDGHELSGVLERGGRALAGSPAAAADAPPGGRPTTTRR